MYEYSCHAGEEAPPRSNRFFFEKSWLSIPNFSNLICSKWGEFARDQRRCFDLLDLWQLQSGKLRSFLKGWGANLKKEAHAEKESLLSQIKDLDLLADGVGLSEEDWGWRYHLEDLLVLLYQREEVYWRQRSRVRWTLQGDANRAYFHAIANGRRRKCAILSLQTPDGPIVEKNAIQAHVYNFYRELTGTKEPQFLTLVEGLWAVDNCVSPEENIKMAITFSEWELDEVLAQTKTETAPGPDGLPVAFFKSFWNLVRPLILGILNDFTLGRVDISWLNFGILSLLPKVTGADSIKLFRPIALINVVSKFISKAFAIRLALIAHRTISLAQTTFIKGRCLLDGALALHEIIDELKSANHKAVILKLDFEKAYDRVSWAFLRSILLRKVFDAAVVHRLMQLVSGGQTAININGEVGPFFRNKRGVRQGDPISPLLFDFMADALSALLDAAARAGHLRGVVPHLIRGGVTDLQYADDTILLLDLDDNSIANLKFILIAFEILSGLKINYLKSEVIVMGAPPSEHARVAQALNCKEGKFPFTYLRFPMSDRALTMADWEGLIGSVGHRVDPWQGRFMSSAARLTFINSSLSSLTTFTMGLFLLAEGTHAGFDKHLARFFWEGIGDKRKFHWVNWPAVCRPKDQGGLGGYQF
jgi:hypothetical protein